MPYEAMFAETILMAGHRGDRIDAYLARPFGAGPYPGVVVIHHMPGWDRPPRRSPAGSPTRATWPSVPTCTSARASPRPRRTAPASARRAGCPTIARWATSRAPSTTSARCPTSAARSASSATARAAARPTWRRARCAGSTPPSTATAAGWSAKPEELTARQPVAPIDYTKNLQCPLLGLFGVEDTRPSPADTARTEAALQEAGKTYEFHTYENAGHAFFAVDRPHYRQAAAMDGWKKVLDWFERHLH